MRRISTSIRVLAIIGMLLHAGMIVWHNAAMLGATLERNALAAALGEICHSPASSSSASESREELPKLPSPGNDQGSCPVCKGCVSAVAILSVPGFALHRPDTATAQMESVGEAITLRLAYVRPPTRAPPLSASA